MSEIEDQSQLLADVESLRQQYPRTQDLYREVCVLLFFRYGVTPTTNKLYQLVRKGSMSAPTEALGQFWQTLRQRSRVSVEHADLPDELKTSAGDMLAGLWKTAQAAALDALAQFRAEAEAAVDAARAAEAQAAAAHAETTSALERTREQLAAAAAAADQLRQDLAGARAESAAVERQLAQSRADAAAGQRRMDDERHAHRAELEKLAERMRLAEERFADMEKRALVEIDRERTIAAKLQKSLDGERAAHAAALERLRTEANDAQLTIARLNERIGAMQGAAAASADELARANERLGEARGRLEAAIAQAATESARAAHLQEELARLRDKPEAAPAAKTADSPGSATPGARAARKAPVRTKPKG
ncbi:DNA-binding protein [Massilia niastensis]|uniref:DNA-binding protein n=1 Tax=Massilia niastensis TaxID=544911 RepID=UPI0003778289|nr:DNA-binding protein [Massilia niastensis]